MERTKEIKMWYEDEAAVRIKKEKVVVKLFDKKHNFLQAINIPTVNYPLNDQPVQTFSFANTKEVTDPEVRAYFDNTKYIRGHCYSNSDTLARSLAAAGYDAVVYVGWLFVDQTQLPVHHAWVVLNNESVLDLADDELMFVLKYKDAYNNAPDEESKKEVFVSFVKESKNWANSDRCYPLGIPCPDYFYVGSPCSMEEGIKIYQSYVTKHPEYEANCDAHGRSPIQRRLAEENLL